VQDTCKTAAEYTTINMHMDVFVYTVQDKTLARQ